jgi:hypothetical protein
MTKVAILPEPTVEGEMMYRAVAGPRQALAKSAGGALDALAAQLPADNGGTLVVVQNHQPDRFFSSQEQQRLEEQMRRWRVARDTGQALPPAEESELKDLVDAEARASGKRAAAALADLER